MNSLGDIWMLNSFVCVRVYSHSFNLIDLLSSQRQIVCFNVHVFCHSTCPEISSSDSSAHTSTPLTLTHSPAHTHAHQNHFHNKNQVFIRNSNCAPNCVRPHMNLIDANQLNSFIHSDCSVHLVINFLCNNIFCLSDIHQHDKPLTDRPGDIRQSKTRVIHTLARHAKYALIQDFWFLKCPTAEDGRLTELITSQ